MLPRNRCHHQTEYTQSHTNHTRPIIGWQHWQVELVGVAPEDRARAVVALALLAGKPLETSAAGGLELPVEVVVPPAKL